MAGATTTLLYGLCIFQFLIIVMLMNREYRQPPTVLGIYPDQMPKIAQDKEASFTGLVEQSSRLPTLDIRSAMLDNGNGEAGLATELIPGMVRNYSGVAMTMFLHSPTWFQRRYTLLQEIRGAVFVQRTCLYMQIFNYG
jgi:hypothetical protein